MKSKRIVKIIILVLFSPCILGAFNCVAMNIVMFAATDVSFGGFHGHGGPVKFMARHGDRYTAYHFLSFIRDMDGRNWIEGHDQAVVELAKRYPEEAEGYIAYTVSLIFNSRVSVVNRSHLVNTLQNMTGEEFGFYEIPGGYGVSLKKGPENERGMKNLAAWWGKRQSENIERCMKDLRKEAREWEKYYYTDSHGVHEK